MTSDKTSLRIKQLKQLGANRFDVLPEARAIDSILLPDESLLAIIFGRYQKGLPPNQLFEYHVEHRIESNLSSNPY